MDPLHEMCAVKQPLSTDTDAVLSGSIQKIWFLGESMRECVSAQSLVAKDCHCERSEAISAFESEIASSFHSSQ